MTVTLKYNNGNEAQQTFNVLSYVTESIELYRAEYALLNGSGDETSLGYRKRISISFSPLADDVQKRYFLFGFCMSNIQSIVIDSVEYAVTLDNGSLIFGYLNGAYFGDAFQMQFIETAWTYYTDDAVTYTLKPTRTRSAHGISGNTFTMYCNSFDEKSIQIHQTEISFLNRIKERRRFGYRHLFSLDSGHLYNSTERRWLETFALKTNKYIDTSLLNTVNYLNSKVMVQGDSITWKPIQGMQSCLGVSLQFIEKTLRTTAESFVQPTDSPFILDTNTLDDENFVLG